MNEEYLGGQLSTVTDDEYFESLEKLPKIIDKDGNEVDVTSDIVDERGTA